MSDLALIRLCDLDGCSGTYKAKGLCDKHYRRLQRRGSTEDTLGCWGTPIERFMRIGWTVTDDGCFEWSGSIKKDWGYGMFSIKTSTSYPAHRFIYEHTHGELPDDIFVCHNCDNPACVNVDHLFPGTAGDNNRDRHSKGRSGWAPKEDNGNHKLTLDEVREIRAKYVAGTLQRDLADAYGVHQTAISSIVRGATWIE